MLLQYRFTVECVRKIRCTCVDSGLGIFGISGFVPRQTLMCRSGSALNIMQNATKNEMAEGSIRNDCERMLS